MDSGDQPRVLSSSLACSPIFSYVNIDHSNNTVLEEPEFKEIDTRRLHLRTVRMSDAEALMPLITRWDVMKWTSQGPVSDIDSARRWLSVRALGRDVFNFVIELRHNDLNGSTDRAVIGLAGSFHPPQIGYMIHPDYAGNGYATEAIQAIIPELLERMPSANDGGTGFDHLEGWTDINNLASQRILEKCGFTYCEIIPDPENQLRGPSEIKVFRKARPGRSLIDLGLLASRDSKAESGPPTPPVE